MSLNRTAIFSSRLHKLLLRNGPYVRFLGALLSERKTYSSIMETQFVFDMFFQRFTFILQNPCQFLCKNNIYNRHFHVSLIMGSAFLLLTSLHVFC